MSVMTAMKAHPEVKPKYAITTKSKAYKMFTDKNELKWQYSDKKLLKSIDECMEDGTGYFHNFLIVKHSVPPKELRMMVESQKPYKHEDFANMITKKERLILERNAELFPDGHSKIALEFYNTYETVKAKSVSSKILYIF